MSELMEFLRARIDEDEALVRDERYVWPTSFEKALNPARVLAEVESKRRILDEHFGFLNPSGPTRACRQCSDRRADDDPLVHDGRWVRLEPAPCLTVRLLALPYADHSDYDESWRP